MRALIRTGALVLVIALLGLGPTAATALGDGDPGSDVLVYQNLFAAADAGLSVGQQTQLANLLQAADRAGFPIRVAIIATPADLGAITALWHKPQAYAGFLGYELSLAYKQRLVVVMPNGFGFNWPGHASGAAERALSAIPIAGGGTGLFTAAESAVHRLSADAGVNLAASRSATAGGPAAAPQATATPQISPLKPAATSGSAQSGKSTDTAVAVVTLGLVALVALLFGGRLVARRRAAGRLRLPSIQMRHLIPALGVLFVLVALSPILILGPPGASGASQHAALMTNPYLDPGTPLSAAAPDFRLTDQFGRRVSLSSFRGKVVLLAFTDSECTTICPMTTTAMVDAKAMLGSAGSRVQLLGVDANPASTSIEDVSSYSELHGLTREWEFLTGSLPQLRRVWKDYSIYAEIQRGLISHTPALLVIDQHGREAKIYTTQQSYAAVGQLGQILAQEASSLLPGHPPVHSDLSYKPVSSVPPTASVALPRAGGGQVRLGPGRSARLYVFFATWDREITGLAGDLDGLNAYQSSARAQGLPPLTAVDEQQVEPSPAALPDFLGTLSHPLAYPVAIDRTGQVADGYEVLGQPWFVLTSASGRILWYWQVSTSGWPTPARLSAYVRSALARAPAPLSGRAAVARALTGSPAPLAAVHAQADRMLGSLPALEARIRALRGYPIVINAWASWCGPCRSEFGLLASASARYGRRVAFLGADTNDSTGAAQTFLAQHPVSYPSYQTNLSDLNSLAAVGYLPTTIFISPAGKVVYVHIGQYDTQGSLDGDIADYALGHGSG
jgi:cytochrome c biogenesis protein CcmG/thiol:disulfide interchange protein DsbE